jgi:hypothetical protein
MTPLDIDDLERCAEKAGVWKTAILSLVAEVRDLRMMKDEHMLDNQHAYDEGMNRGMRAERVSTTKFLRAKGLAWDSSTLSYAADLIEDSEHHKELT